MAPSQDHVRLSVFLKKVSTQLKIILALAFIFVESVILLAIRAAFLDQAIVYLAILILL